jgi:hypothetical protein
MTASPARSAFESFVGRLKRSVYNETTQFVGYHSPPGQEPAYRVGYNSVLSDGETCELKQLAVDLKATLDAAQAAEFDRLLRAFLAGIIDDPNPVPSHAPAGQEVRTTLVLTPLRHHFGVQLAKPRDR